MQHSFGRTLHDSLVQCFFATVFRNASVLVRIALQHSCKNAPVQLEGGRRWPARKKPDNLTDSKHEPFTTDSAKICGICAA